MPLLCPLPYMECTMPITLHGMLQVLADISVTFQLKLDSPKIIESFRSRFQNLLKTYLDTSLPFKNMPISSNSAVPFILEPQEVFNFSHCRYSQNLSISECARHIKYIGKTNLSTVELVNRIHAIQFQYAASSRAIQRFLTFLCRGLIHESIPNLIFPGFRDHLLQKVPIYSQDIGRHDWCLYLHLRRGLLLPQIFSTYLKHKRPTLLDNFSLHYTFYDLTRLNISSTYNSISFYPLTSMDQDQLDFDEFTRLYNKFNEIIHVNGLSFKSLFVEKVELSVAFELFLEELAGLEDSYELLECTKELISFYQRLFPLEPTLESDLLLVCSIWFSPSYLKESTGINSDKI